MLHNVIFYYNSVRCTIFAMLNDQTHLCGWILFYMKVLFWKGKIQINYEQKSVLSILSMTAIVSNISVYVCIPFPHAF